MAKVTVAEMVDGAPVAHSMLLAVRTRWSRAVSEACTIAIGPRYASYGLFVMGHVDGGICEACRPKEEMRLSYSDWRGQGMLSARSGRDDTADDVDEGLRFRPCMHIYIFILYIFIYIL